MFFDASYAAELQAYICFNITQRGLDCETVEATLGQLAFAMINERRLPAVTRKWAIEQIGDPVGSLDRKVLDTLLEDYKHAELLEISGNAISFANSETLCYFAAIRLKELGLKDKITPPVLLPVNPNSLFGKQVGKWEAAIMMLAALAPDASQYLMEIAEIDPFLAAICIRNGAVKSPDAYQYVKDRLWSITQEQKTIERRQAAAALYLIGDMSDYEAFQQMLNTDRDFDMRITAANAVAKIGGAEAIPTLLEVFHRLTEADVLDSATARHQLCWAIASLGEQAVLPLLEALLDETDFLKRFDLLVGLMKAADPDAKSSPDLLTALGKPDALYKGYAAETLATTLKQIAVPEALDRYEEWRKKPVS